MDGDGEAGEEGENGVGVGGGFDLGELTGVLECLDSGEAAGADEVVLHGEARVWGNGGRRGGEEAVERCCGRGGGRRGGVNSNLSSHVR